MTPDDAPADAAPADGRRPLWLLDVDGVLNAVTRRPDRSVVDDWVEGSATVGGRRWPIWFSPGVVARIAGLLADGAVEVCWLTTWGHAANDDLRELLGLPELPVAGIPEDVLHLLAENEDNSEDEDEPDGEPVSHGRLGGGAAAVDPLTGLWWKLDVVRTLLAAEPDRRVVWTDDDLDRYPEAVEWLDAHADALCIAPREDVGLTVDDLDAVREFIRRAPGRPPGTSRSSR